MAYTKYYLVCILVTNNTVNKNRLLFMPLCTKHSPKASISRFIEKNVCLKFNLINFLLFFY